MLVSTPTEKHLARMYHELGVRGASCEGTADPWPYRPKSDEELICLAAEMARHDPRLFSILVKYLASSWDRFNPHIIRSFYVSMRSPQSIAVMAEFLIGSGTVKDEGEYFFRYLQAGLKPAPLQFFFLNLYRTGGHLASRAADSPLAEYKKWGFLACEAPIIDEAGRAPIGTRDAVSRKNILTKLFKKGRRLKLSEYLAALGGGVSRQQALLDIKSIKGVRRTGSGRAAAWVRAA